MAHRIRSLVEALHKKGLCPRLKIDATLEGVDCPDFIREQWKHEMVVDLDLSWPLELEINDKGIEANLAFSGYVYRCVMPWEAIYIVTSREEPQEFTLIDEHVPEELRAKLGIGPEPEFRGDLRKLAKANKRSGRRRRGHSSAEKSDGEEETQDDAASASVVKKVGRPKLGIVRDDDDASANATSAAGSSAREDESTVEEVSPVAKPKDTPKVKDEPAAAKKTSSSDQEAQRRRSIFKVIDGGSPD